MNAKILLGVCSIVFFENSMVANHPFSPTKQREEQLVKFGIEDQKIQRPIPVKK